MLQTRFRDNYPIPFCFFVYTMYKIERNSARPLAGVLYFWGLTIDPLVCMGVIVVVGLCVDYSVHIAHAFHAAEGSSLLRAVFRIGDVCVFFH